MGNTRTCGEGKNQESMTLDFVCMKEGGVDFDAVSRSIREAMLEFNQNKAMRSPAISPQASRGFAVHMPSDERSDKIVADRTYRAEVNWSPKEDKLSRGELRSIMRAMARVDLHVQGPVNDKLSVCFDDPPQ